MEKCCVPECKRQISHPHILCRDHWLKLPSADQRVVSERLFGWKNSDAAAEWAISALKAAAKNQAVCQ
jgi:hypothetical protein